MGKRKRTFSYHKDPANLKRFRSVIEKFVEDASNSAPSIGVEKTSVPSARAGRVEGAGGMVSSRTGVRGREQGRNQNRKRRRREERKLKKIKNLAYAQKKHVPDMAEYRKAKDSAAADKRQEKREERKKMQEVKTNIVKKDSVKKKEDVRKQGLMAANKQDERILKQIEKQMKMKKKQHLPKSFIDDGLDYILDAIDSDKLYSSYGQFSDEDEADIPPRPTQTTTEPGGDDDNDDRHGDGADDDSDEDSDDDMFSGSVIDSDDSSEDAKKSENITVVQDDLRTSKSILKKTGVDKMTVAKEGASSNMKKLRKSVSFEEKDAGSGEENDSDDSDVASDDPVAQQSDSDDSRVASLPSEEPQSRFREDIYGRLRDEKGNIVSEQKAGGAYIPPSKRLKMAESEDGKRLLKLERLKKQLKGLVNRVSEANIQPISIQIEEIYRTNSRADVSESLCAIVMEACVSTVMTPERLAMELTMLIAILHGNVGPEVGACFIQSLAKRLKSLQTSDRTGLEGKEVDNLVSLFAHLYNFKVIHSQLVFDLLKRFTETFGEKDIELILLLLKNVGFSLRKDDASGLKEIIIEIQSKANTVDTSHFVESWRVKFMLETLLAIRNNNVRKIPNYDPTHLDHLRKLIRNYVRGGKLTDNQLRISLSDLMSVEETGRWWLVGSAWSGGLVDRQTDRQTHTGSGVSSTGSQQMTSAAVSLSSSSSSALLESARSQRMNTDTRKTIFCTLMASEDFVDAFEKLLKLGLKHKQEREIVYVNVDCCCQEKKFNPFYAYLLQKFCEYDRRFQMTFQFHLWDKFSVLRELSEQNLTNLSLLLSHLLATKAVSLSVLKTVEFGTLEKPMVRFLKNVLQGILLDHPDHVTKDVFSRIAPLTKLHLLHEGLKLFMHHFLLKSKKNRSLDSDSVLEERIILAENSLSSGQSDML